jgi:polygalacturonase
VNDVTYCDVCTRNLVNPIILTPHYTNATGTLIPDFTGITIRDFHALAGTAATPVVTLDGYDAAHALDVTLDNVVVDGLQATNVKASFADVRLGPGGANFTPSGGGVTVSGGGSTAAAPTSCDGKWVTF